jgi:rhamnose transport system substrate-binding protein
MLEMALKLLPEGGKMAILSATPDATNQNTWIQTLVDAMEADPDTYGSIELVGIVYGNDVPEDSYNEALGLIDQGVDLIMAPTTVGILAAAQAVRAEDVCGEVLVSGFGISVEMQDFVQEGCAQDFALWSFEDLGYLTYYTAYLLASGAMEPEAGMTYVAGRMGEYTIEETEAGGVQVVMGPFTIFSPETIDDWYFEMAETE